MTTGTLASLLSPLSVETFLNHYFGKRPLVIRGTPGKFDALMKPRDFIRNLDQAKEIRCVFGELRQATISPGDIREMFEAGGTICVTGIDRAHGTLRTAARRIEKEIGYGGRVDFRAYLSPPGSGFDIHYDARVATSLQLEGSKTWWYTEHPDSPYPTENSPRHDMNKIRRHVAKLKVYRINLRPGDLLCLPPGVWHKAKAGRGGSLALNLAFNHSGATILDLILQEVRDVLSTDPACRFPFLMGYRGALEHNMRSHIKKCIAALSNALRAIDNDSAVQTLALTSKRHKANR